LGLQKILESSPTIPMVVQPHPWRIADGGPAAPHPDLFILDVDTERDALGTLTQLRTSAPTSKIVLLCGLEDQDRTREAFAAGVDGIILKVQPPVVVLAVIEALLTSATPQPLGDRAGVSGVGRGTPFTKTADPDSLPPVWPEALTEREREIIRLVGKGLSNKDIAYELSISDSTVRHHMTSIFDKVGVPNRQKLLLHTHHVRSTPA
jgi:DNA-binding NarL/FixJ family response regulator